MPGRRRSGGVAGSSEIRTRAGVRSGSRPWIATRSSSTRGRSLAEYLADDFLFVAMKLSNQAGVDEISEALSCAQQGGQQR